VGFPRSGCHPSSLSLSVLRTWRLKEEGGRRKAEGGRRRAEVQAQPDSFTAKGAKEGAKQLYREGREGREEVLIRLPSFSKRGAGGGGVVKTAGIEPQ
jgi:hypothetical protein